MSNDESTDADLRRDLYGRVCDSYHAVDDFRMRLLGLLPVATGSGVFILLNTNVDLLTGTATDEGVAFAAIGLFGFLFSLGLYSYELFGIKKCHYLIVAGRDLEGALGIEGQFTSRPRSIGGVINEPFASALIYPASMAAWSFLALVFVSVLAACLVAVLVFVLGCLGTIVGVRVMTRHDSALSQQPEASMNVVGKHER